MYDILLIWNLYKYMRHLKIKINKQTNNLQRVIYFSHHWNVESRVGIYLFVRESIRFSATSVTRLLKILVYLLHKIRIFYFDIENAFTGYVFFSVHQTCNAYDIQSFIQGTSKQLLLPCPAHRVDGTCDGSLVYQVDLVVDWKMTVLHDVTFQRVKMSLYFMTVTRTG